MDTKKGELTAALWHEYTAVHFDELANANAGFMTRRQISMEQNAIPLIGHVHVDLFTQPRIMIDGVNVKLTSSPAAFCVMRANAQIGGNAPPDYKIKIDSISLYVRKITPSATYRLVMIAGMKLGTVKYLMR